MDAESAFLLLVLHEHNVVRDERFGVGWVCSKRLESGVAPFLTRPFYLWHPSLRTCFCGEKLTIG